MDDPIKVKRPENPVKRANWLSRAILWYSIPIFVSGFRNNINVDTIYEALPEHKSSYLGDMIESRWRKEIKKAYMTKKKPSLLKVLMRMFGYQYLAYGATLAFTELCIKIVQPIALGHFIACYTAPELQLTQAIFYVSLIIFCSFLRAIFKNTTSVGTFVIGMKAKIACSSLIYRKALRLKKDIIEKTGSGKVINMITNDANKFDLFVNFGNYLWVSPFQIVIITYFMYQQVGLSSLIGLSTLILIVPILMLLGKKLSGFRMNTALRTDLRINVMNEIIKGIEAIKMYTWEHHFVKIIDRVRREEIKFLRLVSFMKGIILALRLCLNHLALYSTILVYALLYHTFDAEQIFVLISYYNIIKVTLTMSFGYGISATSELWISIKRMNEFLLIEESQVWSLTDSHNNITSSSFASDVDHAVIILQGSVTSSAYQNILTDISLKIEHGNLVAVVGPVGSGKSSLLFAILRELPFTSGELKLNGTISYSPQEAWIFPATLRQNILFGLPMDKERYKKVVKCCALKRDINLLPYGDKTLIGERGVNLSGGQKARVNLARAVYRDCDIYLLDDPLSAVDTRVGKHIFQNCISGFLKTKTVILVTHQLHCLKSVDQIVLLEDGKIKMTGDYADLQKSVEFVNLLEKVPKSNVKEECLKFGDLATQSYSIEEGSVEKPLQVEEKYKSGSVSKSLYMIYFSAGSNYCALCFNLIVFVTASVSPNICTYFLTFWVNTIQEIQSNSTTTNFENSSEELQNFNRNLFIYSGLVAVTFFLCILRSVTFYSMCMKSSIRLHDRLFKGIIRATMRFFSITSSGRILNRFSGDMGIIDELMIDNMLAFFDIALVIASSVALIVSVNPWLAIPNAIFCSSIFFVRIINLITNTGVKRMEGVTKSPVIGYANVSIQGLSTLRAFNVQSILKEEYDKHQDLYSSTLYTSIVTDRALSLFVDFLGVIYISSIVLSFLLSHNKMLGGDVGMVISMGLGLTTALQFCVRLLTLVENQMTSVERVLEYANVESEAALESRLNKKPPKSWPDRGSIIFHDVCFKYSTEESLILKNLNFVIRPLEKIGIVGRTGAGKSTIIKALFRLAEIDGVITIDNVVTRTIGLHDLRSKISIIPQQPIFFSGTLRNNLDPFDKHDDEAVWRALREVELKDYVSNLPLGLQTEVQDCGSNFSVGQRQLICLARAIISNNKILVLDEATANIDLQTDVLIQKTIKQKFNNCTVLTIAHRLNTVMDSDKVMVLDEGMLLEFDHPHVLLQNTNGLFYDMVHQTDQKTAKELTEVAEKVSTNSKVAYSFSAIMLNVGCS